MHCTFKIFLKIKKISHIIAIKNKKVSILGINSMGLVGPRVCVRNLELPVQSFFYRRELWASKSAGRKGDVPKIYGFVACTKTKLKEKGDFLNTTL